jgi:hypothetical protein
MKKNISIAVCCLFVAINCFAQSNITWTIKDKLGKGAVKTTTVFNSNFSGFSSKDEVVAFNQKLKSNPEVASCEIVSNNGTNSDMKLIMKQAHDKSYYVGLAQKLDLAFIEVNNQKQTPKQMIDAIRNKKK